MKLAEELETRITRNIDALLRIVGKHSTGSIVGMITAHEFKRANEDYDHPDLTSPAKQLAFLLGLMLSTPEPADAIDFGADELNLCTEHLNDLFGAYILLYLPDDGLLNKQTKEWYEKRKTSQVAFYHFYNTGMLASVEQVRDRIVRYLVPFDSTAKAAFGLSVSELLGLCDWVTATLRQNLQNSIIAADEMKQIQQKFVSTHLVGKFNIENVRGIAASTGVADKIMSLMSNLDRIGRFTVEELTVAYPNLAAKFLQLFLAQRGEYKPARYPTEESQFETHPLISLADGIACVTPNFLYSAVLLVCERLFWKADTRQAFLRHRDEALEDETAECFEKAFGQQSKILRSCCETPDGQNEHDIIVDTPTMTLVVECKASPPREPFRDPEKAYPRLRDAFRSDTGIQKAFDQANAILRKIETEQVVNLYTKNGEVCLQLSRSENKPTFAVCVTRDSFGSIATDLSLLLQKEESCAYPWVVNIFDLRNLLEAWKYLGYSPGLFLKFLNQRAKLHGKAFSDDELDLAGYFIRYKGFESIFSQKADFLQIGPEFSSVFDEIYKAIYHGGPRPAVEGPPPVLLDLGMSLRSGDAVFVEPESHNEGKRKIGRNEPCPCGSGKKYKRCHGA